MRLSYRAKQTKIHDKKRLLLAQPFVKFRHFRNFDTGICKNHATLYEAEALLTFCVIKKRKKISRLKQTSNFLKNYRQQKIGKVSAKLIRMAGHFFAQK